MKKRSIPPHRRAPARKQKSSPSSQRNLDHKDKVETIADLLAENKVIAESRITDCDPYEEGTFKEGKIPDLPAEFQNLVLNGKVENIPHFWVSPLGGRYWHYERWARWALAEAGLSINDALKKCNPGEEAWYAARFFDVFEQAKYMLFYCEMEIRVLEGKAAGGDIPNWKELTMGLRAGIETYGDLIANLLGLARDIGIKTGFRSYDKKFKRIQHGGEKGGSQPKTMKGVELYLEGRLKNNLKTSAMKLWIDLSRYTPENRLEVGGYSLFKTSEYLCQDGDEKRIVFETFKKYVSRAKKVGK